MHAALARLPDDQQQLISLKFFLGLSNQEIADATGLTAPKSSALSVLVFGGPATLSRLAQLEQVRPPTMTRLVAELERQGLVERKADPGDRRVVWIHPTESAKKILLEGRARRVARLENDLKELRPAEFKRLASALELLERVARPSS